MSDLQHLPHRHTLPLLSVRPIKGVCGSLPHPLTGTPIRPAVCRSSKLSPSIKSFCLLLPERQRQRIVQDFAHTTPEGSIDVWIEVASMHGLAPGNPRHSAPCLGGLFCLSHRSRGFTPTPHSPPPP